MNTKHISTHSRRIAVFHLVPTLVFSLLVLGVGIFLAGAPTSVSATTSSSESRISDLLVEVPPTITLSNSKSTIQLITSNFDTFYHDSTTLTASTNWPGGYVLTMASADASSTSLLNADTDQTIDSVTSDVTLQDLSDSTGVFPVNDWAYSLDPAPLTYKQIPSYNSPAIIADTTAAGTGEGPVQNDTLSVDFGTKVSSSLPSGVYRQTVLFSITAGPYTPTGTLNDLTTLQDLAEHPTYCENTPVATTKTLTDSRDGKQYRVRKLNDGNCWMIDNLRLGTYGQNLTLTQADSNVANTVTIPSSAIVNAGGQGSWTSGSDPQVAVFYNNFHIFNREDSDSTNYGNLYNWYTATAGTSQFDATQGTNMTSDICPKGWRLPDGWSISSDRPKTFQALYNNYNSSEKMRSTTNNGPEFVLSGYVTEAGNLSYVGSGGSFWSRTAYGWDATSSRYSAYYLGLNSSAVYPQRNYYQSYGYPIRCVSAR